MASAAFPKSSIASPDRPAESRAQSANTAARFTGAVVALAGLALSCAVLGYILGQASLAGAGL